MPRENLLKPKTGDGLTIAYHGLNLGRLSLCAGAAAAMRVFLANLLPWTAFRKTYGQPIQSRELIKRRIARLAALIAGADALVTGPNGGTWLVYHGRDVAYSNPRTLRIDRISWRPGSPDVPVVAGPTSAPVPEVP